MTAHKKCSDGGIGRTNGRVTLTPKQAHGTLPHPAFATGLQGKVRTFAPEVFRGRTFTYP